MRTPRPVAEKLGTVREDPDVHGLLFTLIIRATGDCQERTARANPVFRIGQGRGLISKLRLVQYNIRLYTTSTRGVVLCRVLCTVPGTVHVCAVSVP